MYDVFSLNEMRGMAFEKALPADSRRKLELLPSVYDGEGSSDHAPPDAEEGSKEAKGTSEEEGGEGIDV